MSEKCVGALDQKRLEELCEAYEKDPKSALVRHALSRNPISEIVYNSDAKRKIEPAFSVEVKTMAAANQRSSGRCWIFAGLNVLREVVAAKLGLKGFELSQNYISLFDKIEKANFALESVISLADREPTDRVFQFILSSPVSDGGQWDMFVNLVAKYGLLPKCAFPETFQSENTRETNFLVNAAIRDFAHKAHLLALEGKDKEIRALKDEVMGKIYDMYLSAFGVPPQEFDFEYIDKDDAYHIEKGLTPLSFFQKYIGDSIYELQSCINSPTADKPFGRNFTVDYLGNVVEGKRINHLNLEMERLKELIVAQLKDGCPVWFGSDVSFYRDRGLPAWDSRSFDYASAFGFDIDFEKGAMLDFRHSAMNHAMVITGVDLVEGKPTRWKIENSWGEDNGIKGYYTMSDVWFDRFVYQAVLLKKYLSEEERKATEAEPIHLDPWDPMGTLAD